jgi:amino acid transporter
VIVAVVYYVFVTWMMAVGFGNASAWAKDPAALDTLATRYVGNWLAVIIDFSVAASAFVAALAGTNLTSRTAYAMGREGGLPRVFAWTHPRFCTPWVGIGFSLVVTLLLGVFFAHHYDPITYFIWMATCATIGILITYILIAIGGIAFFAKERIGWSPLFDLVVPAGAIAICGYTLYKSIDPTPAYTGITKWAPWVALIWLALGVAIDVWLTIAKPDRVRAFGSILGAGEGAQPAPEAPPLPSP